MCISADSKIVSWRTGSAPGATYCTDEEYRADPAYGEVVVLLDSDVIPDRGSARSSVDFTRRRCASRWSEWKHLCETHSFLCTHDGVTGSFHCETLLPRCGTASAFFANNVAFSEGNLTCISISVE